MILTRSETTSAYNPASAPDFVPLPLLRSLQLERLQSVVRRAYERVRPYRLQMEAHGVKPEDIHSLDDIRRLPFTVKNDLRDN